MKYFLRLMLLGGLFFLHSLNACYEPNEIIEFAGSEVFAPARLGKLHLYKDGDGFHVVKDSKIYDVQNCFCDCTLRKISDEQLVKFLGRDKPKIIMMSPEEFSHLKLDDVVQISDAEKERILSQLFHRGYISVDQMSDGEYVLQARTGLVGGGFGKKLLNGAAIGACICLGVVGVALVLPAAGLSTVVAGIAMVGSGGTATAVAIGGTAVGVAGGGTITTLVVGGTAVGVASTVVGATVGLGTVAAVGAGGGAFVAAVTSEKQPERPQANNPVAGPNAVYNEDINRVPLELDEISDF